METKKLNELELKHIDTLVSLLKSYGRDDKSVYDILNTTLSLVMSVEYIKERELDSEKYRAQINLIEHFQKNLTKQIINIY